MIEYDVYYNDSLRVTATSVTDAERVALDQIRGERKPAPSAFDPDPMSNVRVTTIQMILERP